MSSDKITVELNERKTIRKGLSQLRSEGKIPGVIHNHGKKSWHVVGDARDVMKVYEEAGKHHPVEVVMGGKKHLTLIKDLDFEPTKNRLRHIVFQAIRQNEEVEAEIPIVFKDVEIPAQKNALLVLRHLDTVEVKALPSNLPDELVVDPSSLSEVGDTLTVADLEVPANVTLITETEHGIATVEMPKDQLAEADAAAAELAADAEGAGEEPETVGEDAGEEDKEESGDEKPESDEAEKSE